MKMELSFLKRAYRQFVFLSSLLLCLSANGQNNIVPNGSFSQGYIFGTYYHCPCDYHIFDWFQTQGSFDHFQLDNSIGHEHFFPPDSDPQNNFIGIYGDIGSTHCYEGGGIDDCKTKQSTESAMVLLTDAIRPNKLYKLRLRVAIENSTHSLYPVPFNLPAQILQIHLCPAIANRYEWYKASNRKKTKTIAFTIPTNNPGTWMEFEEYFSTNSFKLPGSDPNFWYLILEGYENNLDNPYFFIDDVEISEFDVCSSPCIPQATPQILTSTLPNICVTDVYPWNIRIKDAQYIYFNVYDRWGEGGKVVFSSEMIDMFGIKDSWEDEAIYTLLWNGVDNLNRKIPDGIYTYTLEVGNYCAPPAMRFIGSVYVDSGDPTNIISPYSPTQPISEASLQNCCKENYILPECTQTEYDYHASSYIKAYENYILPPLSVASCYAQAGAHS